VLPVVRYDRRASERSLDLLRWGLIPHWAKDINVGFANINAKAEGIENMPAFRDAFERRRYLVQVDNFYEWKKTATGKQPYAIALADKGQGEATRSCSSDQHAPGVGALIGLVPPRVGDLRIDTGGPGITPRLYGPLAHVIRRGTDGLSTHRWSRMDSNVQFRAR
jgi:hypothetical protein